MRFLGVTETCDLGALYVALQDEGHDVRIDVSDPLARGTLAGLVPHVASWQEQLGWIREAGDDGIILFEAVSEGFGATQDALRAEGFRVVGGSAFGDRLENDRAFGMEMLRGVGLPVARVREFAGSAAADAFIAANPGRYVVKSSGSQEADGTFVGVLADGSDVRALLAARPHRADATVILMDHVDGIETGVGAYFDGHRFLLPACIDWEHKRFFPGDLGELTGEMGTVATFDRSGALFGRTLALIEPALREAGHVGYVNLNTIVNADGIWPLEFTARFGYPGFAILAPLQETPWSALLRRMATGRGDAFTARPGFSVGIVLTTPPFPYSRKQVDAPVGLPVLLDRLDGADLAHVHFGEVGMGGGRLATSGLYGWTLVVTGVAATVEAARGDALRRTRSIVIPDMRYRADIGQRLIDGDLARLEALGVFG